jgi:4-amino-4-deoxy-L-arabinose transferase-like glycosyltransferase
MRVIVLLLIVSAGLGLRIESAWQGSPVDMPDSVGYERIARGLWQDGRFQQAGPDLPAGLQSADNYSPGLPLLVAGIFAIRGSDDVRLARLVLALISAAAIPMTWMLGRRLGGEWAGLAGAALIAFYPTLIGDAGLLLTESLAGTLILAAVLLILRARETGRLRSWVLPGVLLGLSAMVRPEYAGITVALGVALACLELLRSGRPDRMMPTAVLVGAAMLVLMPWTARNAVEYGRFVPLSTGGGQALFTGSYMPSGGDPQLVVPNLLAERPGLASQALGGEATGPEPVLTPDRVLAALAARVHPELDTDSALTLMARQRYLGEFRSDPIGFSAFLFNKAHRIWWRGRSTLTDGLPGKLYHWAITALCLVGLAGLARRRRFEFTLLATLLAGATLVGVVLVASPRRALVLWPLVSCLAGVGLVMAAPVLARLPGYRGRPVAIP